MGFTHLQVRSAYSLLNSSIKLADYVSLATLNQFESLALVEEGSMHSAIKFYIACQKAGIKPIIGMSLKIRGEGFEDDEERDDGADDIAIDDEDNSEIDGLLADLDNMFMQE